MDWFENVFYGPEIISHFLFYKVEKEEDLEHNSGLEDFNRYPVDEPITDILLVNDHLDVVKKKKGHWQYWDSTEGVIIKTPIRDYAFYKDNIMWDETVLIFQGHDVLSKLVPLEKHWDVFGKTLSGQAERKLVSLKTGNISLLENAIIKGED